MKKFLKRVLSRCYVGSTLNVKEMISPEHFARVQKEDIEQGLSDSWKDPSVPQRQYEACTRRELENYRKGLSVEPYDVLVNILKENIVDFSGRILLEIGCASGYYGEVLKIKGVGTKYQGCDYSESFIVFAKKLYPLIDFQVQDSCSLTYPDDSFDIVVSGGCLLHIMEYKKAIRETARVAKEHVVFHRTPVLHREETSYYMKTAYGVKMFEIHFNERELLRLFRENHLRVLDIITFNLAIEDSTKDFFAYKTYLCVKS